tara:strand:- start:1054 stop:1965 length:912 start_codon:yes stop_codon:yes gene_type:complete
MALIQNRTNISDDSDYTLQINIQSNIKPPTSSNRNIDPNKVKGISMVYNPRFTFTNKGTGEGLNKLYFIPGLLITEEDIKKAVAYSNDPQFITTGSMKNIKTEEPLDNDVKKFFFKPSDINTLLQYKRKVARDKGMKLKIFSLSKAKESGLITENIRFILNLLFKPGSKFYYNGDERFGFTINNFSIQPIKDQPWIEDASKPRQFVVNISLILNPIDTTTTVKDGVPITSERKFNCVVRKGKIVEDFRKLFDMKMSQSSKPLVSIPPYFEQNKRFAPITARANTRGGRRKKNKHKTKKKKCYR